MVRGRYLVLLETKTIMMFRDSREMCIGVPDVGCIVPVL